MSFTIIVILIVATIVILLLPFEHVTIFGIGCLVGAVAVPLTICIMLNATRKNKTIITTEHEEYRTPRPEVASLASNTYQPSDSHDKVVPNAACSCHNKPHTTLQRKVSACSDYTESHYYTEIDEYFINKRKTKEQKKRFDGPAVHGDKPVPANSTHMDSSVTYDYAYGFVSRK